MKVLISLLILILGPALSNAETWNEKQARFKKEIEARYKKEREAEKKRLADLTKPKPAVKSSGRAGFFYTDQFGVNRYYDPK